MTADAFQKLLETLYKEELQLAARKRALYADNDNVLMNFYDGAAVLHTTPRGYLMSLVSKHFLMLANAQQLSKEVLREYACDIRIYMALLIALAEELGDSV